MECPHCGQETSPTLLYCEVCGEQLQLDLEGVRRTMERDSVAEAIEDAERKSRGALYFSIFLLVTAIVFRIIAIRPVNVDFVDGYYAPFQPLEQKGLEPPSSLEVKAIPLDFPAD
jgi:hypothetical protein